MEGMLISQLSIRSGVPVSTLRYYESEGLLPAERAENGYRVYDEDAIDRLAFISEAKSLSLPLAEIRVLADARDAEPCRSVRTRYRPMLDQHAAQLGARIGRLRVLRSMIADAQRHLDGLPDRDEPCDAGCSLLQGPASTAMTRSETSLIKVDAPEPIACSLDADDYAERAAGWRSLVAGMPCVRTADGLRFELPAAQLNTATALAVAEQRCCSFYRFGFELRGVVFDLTVSAPVEAAGMLAELFGTDAM